VALKSGTIDEYLAGLSRENRTALRKVRRAVHAAAPGVGECISYGMPVFRLDGRVVAGFQTTAKGCSYYPSRRHHARRPSPRTSRPTSKRCPRFISDRRGRCRLHSVGARGH
jgi:hypothetical protein